MSDIINDSKKIDEILERGVDEVIVGLHLQKRLKAGEKLRIKFGVDPTAPDIHLGHLVPLRKLKQFQNLGHQIIFIIGDFTATVGDPSAKKEARKPLTKKEVESNLKDYLKQVGKILNIDKTEIHYNSEWYDKFNAMSLYGLTSKITIQRALERDDFQKRLSENRDISILEIIYPLLQGYDSVMVKSDLEVGGTDQKFNLLMGRKIQKRYGQKSQDIMTTLILEGTDGVSKMSKSLGNYIKIDEPANEMFAKIMSISDKIMPKYFELLTDLLESEYEEKIKKNPKDAKMMLAALILEQLHGAKEAEIAKENFQKVFAKGELNEADIEEKEIKANDYLLKDLLVGLGLVESKSQSQRLILQKAVEINNSLKIDPMETIRVSGGEIVKVGKYRLAKIKAK